MHGSAAPALSTTRSRLVAARAVSQGAEQHPIAMVLQQRLDSCRGERRSRPMTAAE
jgi:hypothetical protein